jgi:hypothetical protein
MAGSDIALKWYKSQGEPFILKSAAERNNAYMVMRISQYTAINN